MMIVDRAWVLFGSSNWDDRSMRLNFEFDVEVYDANMGGSMDDRVIEMMRSSKSLTREQLSRRSLPVKLRDGACRLLTPYL